MNSKGLWIAGVVTAVGVGGLLVAGQWLGDAQPAAALADLGSPAKPASAGATIHPTVARQTAVTTATAAKALATRLTEAPKPAAAPPPVKAAAATPKAAPAEPKPVLVVADDWEMDGFDTPPAAPASTQAATQAKPAAVDEFDDGFDDRPAVAATPPAAKPVAQAAAPSPAPAPAKRSGQRGITPEMLDAMAKLPGGIAALPELDIPADNPMSEAKVELGRLLYFDTRLSGDLSMSCASCHNPDAGFSDGLERARGFGGMTLGRHSPTVLNAAYNRLQMWDGRFPSLEAQAKGPIMADVEMNMGSPERLVERLNADARYPAMFQEVFGAGPSLELVAKAIAAFERTVITPDSPFDRYAAGDKDALTEQQKRGLGLFIGKASCVNCHSGVNFTDDKFHNLGLVKSNDRSADAGRSAISGDDKDFGAFRTPTVRNATRTAPYMHDGSVATLEELVEFYDRGGHDGVNKSPLIKPLGLTGQEKADLVAFIEALTGEQPDIKDPWSGTTHSIAEVATE